MLLSNIVLKISLFGSYCHFFFSALSGGFLEFSAMTENVAIFLDYSRQGILHASDDSGAFNMAALTSSSSKNVKIVEIDQHNVDYEFSSSFVDFRLWSAVIGFKVCL